MTGRPRCRRCSTPRPLARTARSIPKRDLWHLRSLLFTEPVDFLIGNTYGKYLERDTGVPLIRMVFPIFDRHHYHRYPIWGYDGGMRVLVMLLDEFFEALDANTMDIPGEDRLQLRHHPLTGWSRCRAEGAAGALAANPDDLRSGQIFPNDGGVS